MAYSVEVASATKAGLRSEGPKFASGFNTLYSINMNLLVVTQKVDKEDENLGFFHRWLEEFARHADLVLVMANSVGHCSLPGNVKVYSLGKEKSIGKFFRLFKFWWLLGKYSRKSDAVFFHMIPEFVLAAAPFFVFSRKPMALWYTHKSVTRKLRLAEKLVDYIFTASELSFRLPSKKVVFTGHAIDVDFFKPSYQSQNSPPENIKMVTVGRISPVKNIETVIRACCLLKNSWNKSWALSIVGGPIMARDHEYFNSLKKVVQDAGLADRIFFHGARPYTEVPEIYADHDIFISMSSTGSIDKSVLEAMSAGLTVLTANEAFQSILPNNYFLEKRSPDFLAGRIKFLADESRPNRVLRELVVKHHSLEKTISKIMEVLSIPV